MSAVLCPTGGSYWNPKPLWWLWDSWLSLGLYRVYNVVRIAMWLVGRTVDLLSTLFFAVLMPIVGYLVTFISAFTAFMIGLLGGEINIEWSIMAPLLALLLSWVWWALYPTWGCWFEDNIIPLYPMIGDITNKYIGLGAIIWNVVVRVWNACVPLIGAIIAVCIELFVLFFQLLVQLLGDGSFFKLFNLLTQIMVGLTEIVIAVIDALVSISPSVIQAFVGAIGYCLTVIMEAAPFLIAVTTWLVKVLFFLLSPVLSLVIAIARAFSGGNTLRQARNDEPPGSWPDSPPPQTSVPYAYGPGGGQVFEYTADAANEYWSVDSALFARTRLEDMNQWNLKNPPGSHSYYHYANEPTLSEMPDIQYEYMSFEMMSLHHDQPPPDLSRYDDEYDAATDEYYYDYSDRDGDENPDAATPVSLAERQARSTGHRDHGKQRERQINNRTAHTHVPTHDRELTDRLSRSHLRPLHHDFHKRVQCKSRLCGGHGRQLPHPILAIKRDRSYAGHVFGLGRETHDEHRRRFVHTTAALHAARRAVHHVWRHHYHESDGWMEHHSRNVLRELTGFDSASQLAEHAMSHHEYPYDSLLSYVPVLSEVIPGMRFLVDWHDQDHADQFYGNWVRQRLVFYNNNATDAVYRSRRQLHVTLETRQELELHADGRRLLQYEPSSYQSFSAPVQFVTPLASDKQKNVKDRNTAPSLPVFKMLARTDCVRRPGSSKPLNPLCLPEIPAQLVCAITHVVSKLFNDKLGQIKTCDYEPRCADIGFCIPPRPPVNQDIFLVANNIQYFINSCWLKNGVVWLAVGAGFVFPLAKTLLQIAGSQLLVIKPLTDWLYQLTPDVLVFNDLFCLFLYWYALFLLIFLLVLARILIYPILLWFWRTFTSLEAMYSAIRSIEMSRLARIEASEWYQLQERQFYIEPYRALRNDPWLVKPRPVQAYIDPAADLPSLGELQQPFAGATPLVSARIASDIESGALHEATQITTSQLAEYARSDEDDGPVGAGPEAVTPAVRQSMLLYTNALCGAREYFGEPDPTVTLEDARRFEQRFGPLIQSLHFSNRWLSQYLGEYFHQRTASWTRRPAQMPHWAGSEAPHLPPLQTAAGRPLLVPDARDSDL